MAYTDVWDVTSPLDTQAANQGAADFRATKLDVMQRISSFGAGLLASRPTPEATSGTADWTGVMYWATDTHQCFRWNGTAWVDISLSLPGGGGGSGVTIFSSAAQINAPANTAKNVIYTGNVAANSLGATGGVDIQFNVFGTGGAGTFVISIDFGGVNVHTLAGLSNGSFDFHILILNATTLIQGSKLVMLKDGATARVLPASPTGVDTTVSNTLTVSITKTVGADVIQFFNGLAKQV